MVDHHPSEAYHVSLFHLAIYFSTGGTGKHAWESPIKEIGFGICRVSLLPLYL